jgi:hypothetical protein
VVADVQGALLTLRQLQHRADAAEHDSYKPTLPENARGNGSPWLAFISHSCA